MSRASILSRCRRCGRRWQASVFGIVADGRLRRRPSDIARVVTAVAGRRHRSRRSLRDQHGRDGCRRSLREPPRRSGTRVERLVPPRADRGGDPARRRAVRPARALAWHPGRSRWPWRRIAAAVISANGDRGPGMARCEHHGSRPHARLPGGPDGGCRGRAVGLPPLRDPPGAPPARCGHLARRPECSVPARGPPGLGHRQPRARVGRGRRGPSVPRLSRCHTVRRPGGQLTP